MSKVGGPRITEEIQTSTRVDLNRALNELIEPVQTLCFEVAKREMPACPDWTSVMLYPQILALFSQMSARVMVGPELCESWPPIAMKYITRVLAAQGCDSEEVLPRALLDGLLSELGSGPSERSTPRGRRAGAPRARSATG